MLESIFPNEFRFEDENGAAALKDFLAGRTNDPPPFTSFILDVVNVEESTRRETFEMRVTLSQDYPNALPDIYLRNCALTGDQASTINRACVDYVATLTRGEPCIYSAVVWLQETAPNYATTTAAESEPEDSAGFSKAVRYWIYSHHIYSKTKRREILSLAGRLNVAGFCMPGKPGIICVEGHESDCSQWWSAVRGMTWQKIMCKVTEEAKTRRFRTFEEVALQTHGNRSNHSDLGALYKYLAEHELAYIFKELFGIEGGK